MKIAGALKHLLTPAEGGFSYGRRVSPIEDAFNGAVLMVARQVAADVLAKDDTVTARMREILAEALDRIMVTNREKTVDQLADALAAGMAYRGRD